MRYLDLRRGQIYFRYVHLLYDTDPPLLTRREVTQLGVRRIQHCEVRTLKGLSHYGDKHGREFRPDHESNLHATPTLALEYYIAQLAREIEAAERALENLHTRLSIAKETQP